MTMLLQAAIVLALIAVGVHYKGMAIGLFGGLGVLIFAVAFGVAPGPLPVAALLIILSVVTAAGAMQLAGGVEWLVGIAERAIRKYPDQISYVAPLVSFLFCAGAGNGAMYYPLMPVIYEVAHVAGVRPERPLALSATAGQLALSTSPVSAAMAVMVTLLAPLGFRLVDILAIVFPGALLSILAGGFVMNRLGKDLAEDREYQRRLAAGEVAPPAPMGERPKPPAAGRRAAWLFIAAVAVIVLAGLFDRIHPHVMVKGALAPLDMPQFIQMTMLTASALIVVFCGVRPAAIPASPLFASGLVALVALFGVAWMANTFVAANQTVIVGELGDLARHAPLLIGAALFAVAAITTSQSSSTAAIIPVGIALGIAPQYLTAMWPAIVGAFLFPTNGQQIATVEFDRTGTTRIGRFVVNHSFIVPVAVFTVVSVGAGFVIAALM